MLSKTAEGTLIQTLCTLAKDCEGGKVTMLYRNVYRNFCPNTHWLKTFAISPI